ncbi:MAG: fibronectin type III domain-containing protein, partial [Chthoniobacterales bacterium]
MKTLNKSLAVCSLLLVSALAATAQINITTWQVNNQHTGANLNETILTPAIVSSPGNFGLLFEQPFEGQCYGQPLIVSGLVIGSTTHNVVYLATQHDMVYAFDADNNVGPNVSPIWSKSLLLAGAVAVPQSEVFSGDISDKLSITATPVIDLPSQTLYVLSKYKITSSGAYQQRLHALDLKTGAEKFGGPVNVNPTFAGSASDNSGGVIPFHQLEAHGRPALTLSNGVVYLMYSSHSDHTPYHGEIVGYNASTLAWIPSKTFIASPNSQQSGIWMGGASAAVDSAGNMYVSTGNGAFDQNSSPFTTGTNWGESILKLPASGAFTVAFSNPLNWFTPNNWATLNGGDVDLGSGGILLLPDQAGPHPHLLVTGGKGGTLYVIDRDNMGGLHTPNNSVQETTEGNSIFVTPAYFNGNIYYAAGGNKLTQRPVSYNSTNGQYLGTAIKSTFTYNGGHGAHAFISANGTSNGIVWALDLGTPAKLHAYNATNVSGNPIFTGSATLPGGINCTGPKFCIPTVVNGKAYFTAYDSTNTSHLFVFAQPAPAAGTPTAPSNVTAVANSSGKITVTWQDNSNNELGFTVKRAPAAAGPFVALSPNPNADETSFIDSTGLSPGTTYYYQVLAYNN